MEFPPPMRCYTCNMPLAGKWFTFLELVKKNRKEDGRPEKGDLTYLTTKTEIAAEGRAMNELGLVRECCRIKMFTHAGV